MNQFFNALMATMLSISLLASPAAQAAQADRHFFHCLSGVSLNEAHELAVKAFEKPDDKSVARAFAKKCPLMTERRLKADSARALNQQSRRTVEFKNRFNVLIRIQGGIFRNQVVIVATSVN